MSETDRLLEEDVFTRNDDAVVVKDDNHTYKQYFSNVPNFIWIEISLLFNVFLFGFDGTITSSIYSTIGNEFKAINLVSWISSSYMIASSTTLPLASISDLLGRRSCICFALIVFGVGCLGCSVSSNMALLILARTITGIGGGGLLSLSTITNSDIIYPSKRGLFQAIQNLVLGTGAVCGASFGGLITSYFGWRWCFGFQVVPAIFSLIVAKLFIPNVTETTVLRSSNESVIHKIDFSGSITMVLALSSQLLILTIGGNEIPWADWKMCVLFVFSILSAAAFFIIEANTTATPIVPIKDYNDRFVILHIALAYFVGVAAYTYIFILPLLFQLNLGDTVAQTGLRLSIPAIATPIGGIIAGYYMAKLKSFMSLVLVGTALMAFGNYIALGISHDIPGWLTNILLIPANVGQGLAYPSSLFSFVYHFESTKQATSTSTVYLMRNIGGVWGISSITTITQGVLKGSLKGKLLKLDMDEKEADTIISTVLKSLDVLKDLSEEVRNVIIKDYTFAIRICQFFSGTCCVVAFVCCYSSRKYMKKHH